MNSITPYMSYIKAAEEPLSADVYFIFGSRYVYIYDVGANADALEKINAAEKEKVVVLSHFHPDHISNIGKVNFSRLYVGKKTFEKIHIGETVKDKVVIDDGVHIEIERCTSPHADGSLILTVNSEYTLIGDLYYTREGYNHEKAINMIKALRELDTKYFVISHREENNIVEKNRLTDDLTKYFGAKKAKRAAFQL